MPGVAGAGRSSSSADVLPRGGKWVFLGTLTVFVGIAVGQHPHGTHHSLTVTIVAAVVAIGAAELMIPTRGLHRFALALVSTAAVTVLSNGLSSSVGWLAVCVLAGWLVLSVGRAAGLIYLAAALALFGAEWIWAQTDPGWGPWMAGTAFTVMAALLIRHERDLVTQLRAAQASLAESARSEERNRIARELHDVIAHTLIVSQLHVASARLAVENDPASASQALAEAERLGRESLAEVRRAVGLLRDDGDGGSVAPLPGAGDLPALIERFRSAGADVTLTVTGDVDPVPATTGLALYRILQEALTNAAKHASGWPVAVHVTVDGGQARLVVESGAPPGQGHGVGLESMRERAGSVGGTCTAGPGGPGWVVEAELPIGGRP
jgi:signal transduction histidine kinase